MSEEVDWDFAGEDHAKMTIRAATRYLHDGAYPDGWEAATGWRRKVDVRLHR